VRFPWNLVKGWKVYSTANGHIVIEPDYINPWKGPELGGGPGMFTRMRLALWVSDRLMKSQETRR
jgi:hypothetical protein